VAADLIVLTATKPLTAPLTGIGFGRPPPLTGLEILRRVHISRARSQLSSNVPQDPLELSTLKQFRSEYLVYGDFVRQEPYTFATSAYWVPLSKDL
jgi:hypothetical protein